MSALQVRLSVVGLFLAMVLMANGAHAQYAPVPKSAPRTPVKRELLNGRNEPVIPASRVLEGRATFLDAERLRIGDVEMRLFGVVPPQMGASYGPQARAVVDALSQGDISCRIQDRSRDGQYMAVCKNTGGVDFGLELLRRGLAATARGTLQSSELGPAYLAAEQAAQLQRMGIWSATLPSALSDKVIKEAVAKVESVKAEAVAKAEAEADARIKEAAAKIEAAKAQAEAAEVSPIAIPAGALAEPVGGKGASVPPAKPEPKTMEMGPTAADVQAVLSAPAPEEQTATESASMGFFERYQLLTTGVLTLLAAMTFAGTFLYRHARDRREDLKALAAALRGELMAARSICLARLAKMTHEPDDRHVTWPRLRTLVFQAYVGRLGHLGADLARQISSIYGQASDYASYYVGAEARPELASKKQALQTLVQHIEEVMPRLTQVEQQGTAPRLDKPSAGGSSGPSMLSRVLRPMALGIERHLPASGSASGEGRGQNKTLPAPEPVAEEPAEASPLMGELPEVKTEMLNERRSAEMRAKHRAIADARVLAEQEADKNAEEESSEVEAIADDTVVLKKDILQNIEQDTAPAAKAEAENEAAAAVAEPVTPILQEPKEEVVASVREEGALAADDSKKKSISSLQSRAGASPDVKATVIAAASTLTKTSTSLQSKTNKAVVGPATSPEVASSGINFAAPIFERLSRIRDMASAQIDRLKPQPIEDLLPDYANLTEEELEALSYAEAYLAACTPPNKRKAG